MPRKIEALIYKSETKTTAAVFMGTHTRARYAVQKRNEWTNEKDAATRERERERHRETAIRSKLWLVLLFLPLLGWCWCRHICVWVCCCLSFALLNIVYNLFSAVIFVILSRTWKFIFTCACVCECKCPFYKIYRCAEHSAAQNLANTSNGERGRR